MYLTIYHILYFMAYISSFSDTFPKKQTKSDDSDNLTLEGEPRDGLKKLLIYKVLRVSLNPAIIRKTKFSVFLALKTFESQKIIVIFKIIVLYIVILLLHYRKDKSECKENP